LHQVGDIAVALGDFLNRRVEIRLIFGGKDRLVADGWTLRLGLPEKHVRRMRSRNVRQGAFTG
jgi:hypothetical protein